MTIWLCTSHVVKILHQRPLWKQSGSMRRHCLIASRGLGFPLPQLDTLLTSPLPSPSPSMCVPAISSQAKCHSMVPSSTSSLTNNLLCCHVVGHRSSSTWHASPRPCSSHRSQRRGCMLCPPGPAFIKLWKEKILTEGTDRSPWSVPSQIWK